MKVTTTATRARDRVVPSAAAEAVAHAVRAQVLPSLAAFYSQDLTLLACTESYAADRDATADELCGRRLHDVLDAEEHEQLIGPALRAVAGFTVHTTLRRRGGRGQWLTLVGYVVDGEQLGVAVLTGG